MTIDSVLKLSAVFLLTGTEQPENFSKTNKARKKQANNQNKQSLLLGFFRLHLETRAQWINGSMVIGQWSSSKKNDILSPEAMGKQTILFSLVFVTVF